MTRQIHVGGIPIGGGAPVTIQSMTNTKTEDVKATVEQILRLERAGCEIIRCAVPNMDAAKAIGEIKKQIHIPLVQIFILIIVLRLRPWRTVPTRSVSIPEILEAQSVVQWQL